MWIEGPDEALVLLDGNEVGQTPLAEPLEVEAGDHVVEARAEGYQPSRRPITIAGGVEQTVTLTLVRIQSPGAILITTNVSGVTISVDDEEVGQSPLGDAVTAAPGRHVVVASRPGYSDARLELEVQENEVVTAELSLTPRAVLPPDLGGTLALNVSEEHYEVFLDGEPFQGGAVPIGGHTLTVRLAGFEDWSWAVDVAAGIVTTVDVTLRPTEDYLERYRHRANRYRTAAWVTAGLGVALLGTTLGLYIWNDGRDEDWSETASALETELSLSLGERTMTEAEIDTAYDEAQDLGRELQTWSSVEWALFSAGVASVLASIILFAVGPSTRRYEIISVTPTPAPGGGSLSVSW